MLVAASLVLLFGLLTTNSVIFLVGLIAAIVAINAAISYANSEESQRHRRYCLGAEGEKLVAAQLSQLPDCHIFHDVFLPNSKGTGGENIDHIIVCLEGVFTIETKNHRNIVVNKQGIWRRRQLDNKIMKQVKRQHKDLNQRLILKTTPLVVFVPSETVIRHSPIDGVHICQLQDLPQLLLRLREQGEHALRQVKHQKACEILQEMVSEPTSG